MNKLLIICGPTATGKTKLAIEIARKFNGEIISADSRQVYKGMDLGTGKDIHNFQFQISNFLAKPDPALQDKLSNKDFGYYIKDNIKIWGCDLVNPDEEFSVNSFVNFCKIIIPHIQKSGKLAIVVGGTGLYIKALLAPFETINIPLNKPLREKLDKFTVLELQNELKKLDPAKFDSMNYSDQNNPRRLVRAIEVAEYLKHLKGVHPATFQVKSEITNHLILGLTADKDFLFQKIKSRIQERFKAGIIDEIKELLGKGYSWKLPSMSATGYFPWKGYFENKKTVEQALSAWQQAEQQYSRRQMTWFKKMPGINWFDIEKENWQKTVLAKVEKWYTKSTYAAKD